MPWLGRAIRKINERRPDFHHTRSSSSSNSTNNNNNNNNNSNSTSSSSRDNPDGRFTALCA